MYFIEFLYLNSDLLEARERGEECLNLDTWAHLWSARRGGGESYDWCKLAGKETRPEEGGGSLH